MVPDVPSGLRPWKLWIRIATCQTSMPRSMHILWRTEGYRSLGEIDGKDVELFLERVGPWILSLESVDYSRTELAEYFSPNQRSEKKKNLYEQNFDGEANCPGVENFHCMQIESCDKHADYFRRWLKQGAKFFTFSYFGNNVFSLESKPLIFVYLCTRTKQNCRIRSKK